VIQVATVVNYFELQKGVLMHEEDHPARDLMLESQAKLNRIGCSRTKSGDSMFKDGSSDGIRSHNGTRSRVSAFTPHLAANGLMPLAPTTASIVLTPSGARPNCNTPSKILTGSVEPMRVLVAEDDAPLAEFLHQRLQQEQFAVHMVSSGAEAEQLASDQAYDLVLLDLNLPGAGGLGCPAWDSLESGPDLPVVIVTAASMWRSASRTRCRRGRLSRETFAFAELAARFERCSQRKRPGRSILQIETEVDRVSTPCAAEVTTSI